MGRKNILAFYIVFSMTLAIGGCVPVALHPLADENVSQDENRIVGTWRPYDPAFGVFVKDVEWTVEKVAKAKYALRVKSQGAISRYVLRVVQLGDMRFFDIVARDSGDTLQELNSIRVHQVFAAKIMADSIEVKSTISAARFAAVATKHGLPFTRIGGRVVLTASTNELQRFFKVHGSEVFSAHTTVLRRQRTD